MILLYSVCEVYIERVVCVVLGRGEVNLNWNSLSELKIAIDSLAPSEYGKKGQEKRKIFFHQGLTLYFLHDANGSSELLRKISKIWEVLPRRNYTDNSSFPIGQIAVPPC